MGAYGIVIGWLIIPKLQSRATLKACLTSCETHHQFALVLMSGTELLHSVIIPSTFARCTHTLTLCMRYRCGDLSQGQVADGQFCRIDDCQHHSFLPV